MTARQWVPCLLWPALAVLASGQDLAVPAGPLKARLLAPLNTEFSRKGDLVAARITEPDQMKDAILLGEVQEVRAGGVAGKVSTIEFEIQSVQLGAKSAPVAAALSEIRNSRGQAATDEQGARLESGGGALSAVGSKLSGVLSRGPGPVHLSAKAANLTFAAGSELVLQAQIRRGK